MLSATKSEPQKCVFFENELWTRKPLTVQSSLSYLGLGNKELTTPNGFLYVLKSADV